MTNLLLSVLPLWPDFQPKTSASYSKCVPILMSPDELRERFPKWQMGKQRFRGLMEIDVVLLHSEIQYPSKRIGFSLRVPPDLPLEIVNMRYQTEFLLRTRHRHI